MKVNRKVRYFVFIGLLLGWVSGVNLIINLIW